MSAYDIITTCLALLPAAWLVIWMVFDVREMKRKQRERREHMNAWFPRRGK